jgi:hypothetical protein
MPTIYAMPPRSRCANRPNALDSGWRPLPRHQPRPTSHWLRFAGIGPITCSTVFASSPSPGDVSIWRGGCVVSFSAGMMTRKTSNHDILRVCQTPASGRPATAAVDRVISQTSVCEASSRQRRMATRRMRCELSACVDSRNLQALRSRAFANPARSPGSIQQPADRVARLPGAYVRRSSGDRVARA